jgi:hypothetical protein
MQEAGTANPIEDILELFIDYSSEKARSGLDVLSGWNGFFLVGCGIGFIVCIALTVAGMLLKQHSRVLQDFISFFLWLGIMSYAALVYQLANIAVRLFTQPVASFLRMRIHPVKRDYELLSRLRDFPTTDLRFVRARLQNEAEQLRGRIGILVGAIDKIGIVPLVAGGIVSGWKFAHDANPKPGYLEICVAGLGLFYLLGVNLTLASHRIDQFAQLLELAIPDQE